jgi:hypothetical protein
MRGLPAAARGPRRSDPPRRRAPGWRRARRRAWPCPAAFPSSLCPGNVRRGQGNGLQQRRRAAQVRHRRHVQGHPMAGAALQGREQGAHRAARRLAPHSTSTRPGARACSSSGAQPGHGGVGATALNGGHMEGERIGGQHGLPRPEPAPPGASPGPQGAADRKCPRRSRARPDVCATRPPTAPPPMTAIARPLPFRAPASTACAVATMTQSATGSALQPGAWAKGIPCRRAERLRPHDQPPPCPCRQSADGPPREAPH